MMDHRSNRGEAQHRELGLPGSNPAHRNYSPAHNVASFTSVASGFVVSCWPWPNPNWPIQIIPARLLTITTVRLLTSIHLLTSYPRSKPLRWYQTLRLVTPLVLSSIRSIPQRHLHPPTSPPRLIAAINVSAAYMNPGKYTTALQNLRHDQTPTHHFRVLHRRIDEYL